VGLPLTFLGFSRNLYGLIDSIPLFLIIFPTFRHFLIIGGVSLIPFCILLGHAWIKSPFYREGKKAPAKYNPFAWELAPGRDSKLFFGGVLGQKNMLRLFKAMGTITDDEAVRYQEYIELLEVLEGGGSIQ
jgi:hypothetical protein